RLNKKYNIDCLRRFQRNAETVEDLINIARSIYYNKAIQQSSTKIHNVQQTLAINQEDIPNDVLGEYKLGRILGKSKRYQASAKILQQVVETQPEFYLAWYHLALAYDGLEELDKAETAFNTAIKLENSKQLNDPRIYNAYGMFLLKQEKYKEAAEQFKKEKRLKSASQSMLN
ncbi:MAG: tetratricopeptide repeat protein, partial [Methylococcaceae bacterium]|nr:tetratricopeptide repeat protein [Methylococcaceae bacterium]